MELETYADAQSHELKPTYTFLAVERVIYRSQEHVFRASDVDTVGLEFVRPVLESLNQRFFFFRLNLK